MKPGSRRALVFQEGGERDWGEAQRCKLGRDWDDAVGARAGASGGEGGGYEASLQKGKNAEEKKSYGGKEGALNIS